jgi:uncharacterized membrane protein
MQSKVAIMGHPIHPMLVALPIGLFVWTLIADIVFGIRQEQGWYDIAFWSGIAAWIAGVAAALPGLGDYFGMAVHTEAKGMASTHMLLNVTTVACYIVAMILMLDNNAFDLGTNYQAVLGLHSFGALLLVVSGWLGGEMVFRHHLGVIPGREEPVSMRRAA